MVLIPRNPVNQNPLHKHEANSGTAEAGTIMHLTPSGVAKITTSGQAPYGILFSRVAAGLAGMPQNFEFPGEIGTSDQRLGDPVLLYQDGGTFETSEYALSGASVSAGTKLYCLADGSADAGKLTEDITDAADDGGTAVVCAVVMEGKYKGLREKAHRLRVRVLETAYRTKKAHIGGTYSCVELLVALYHGGILKYDLKNPQWDERDRLAIGKGHVCLAIFYILVDIGFMDSSRLDEYGTDGSSLGGQLDTSVPGVETNTGSMGHALGLAAGMALAAKLDNKKYKSIALIGDGECTEGSIWESASFASRQSLNNLTCLVDRNKLSVTEVLEEDGPHGRIEDKFRACGWDVFTIDGHSFDEIFNAFAETERSKKPVAIIADTIKGKGISFMENGIKWHHGIPNEKEYELAKKELEKAAQ